MAPAKQENSVARMKSGAFCSWISFHSIQAMRHSLPCLSLLQRFTEGEIDATTPRQWVVTLGERRNAMKREPRQTAPHDHVAVFQSNAAWPVTPAGAAEQKECRHSE